MQEVKTESTLELIKPENKNIGGNPLSEKTRLGLTNGDKLKVHFFLFSHQYFPGKYWDIGLFKLRAIASQMTTL